MFGYDEVQLPLGSRRLGGPLLLRTIVPTVLEELREVHVTAGGASFVAPAPPGTSETESETATTLPVAA